MLYCSVCLDPIVDTARSLLCGHIFCRRCVTILIANAGSGSENTHRHVSISCPECRRPSGATNGDIRDVFIKDWAEVHGASTCASASTSAPKSTENEYHPASTFDVSRILRGSSPQPRPSSPSSSSSSTSSIEPAFNTTTPAGEEEDPELHAVLLLSQRMHDALSQPALAAPAPATSPAEHPAPTHAHAHTVHRANHNTSHNTYAHRYTPFPAPASARIHTTSSDPLVRDLALALCQRDARIQHLESHLVLQQSLVSLAHRQLDKTEEELAELTEGRYSRPESQSTRNGRVQIQRVPSREVMAMMTLHTSEVEIRSAGRAPIIRRLYTLER